MTDLRSDVSLRAAMLPQERGVYGLELRESTDSPNHIRFRGRASTVEEPYVVRDAFGEFTETMAKGAFDKTIAEGDIRLLMEHQGSPLARTRAGTLELSTSPHLDVNAPGLDLRNPKVQELRSAVERRDLDGMSIGFMPIRQEWNTDYTEVRVIEARLSEVSVVGNPVNANTSAALRAHLMNADLHDERDIKAAIVRLEFMLEQRASAVTPADVGPHDFTPSADGGQCKVCGQLASDHGITSDLTDEYISPKNTPGGTPQQNSADSAKLEIMRELVKLDDLAHSNQ